MIVAVTLTRPPLFQGPLPYGDEGGSQSAFAIKMDDPEEFKRAKRELGCDEYDKPGDK